MAAIVPQPLELVGRCAVTQEEYARAVESLAFGKRLVDAVYVHVDGLGQLPAILRQAVAAAAAAAGGPVFQVVKLARREWRLSLLEYPGFRDEPHPVLLGSWVCDLASGRVQRVDYRDGPNPPILHRKEAMFAPGHPDIAPFAALTRAEEDLGLYDDPTGIGFRNEWERLLAELGVTYDGHRLVAGVGGGTPVAPHQRVRRHRTAIGRRYLSRPVQLALRHEVLTRERTFLDYGCGLGDDVAGLAAQGYQADGWDPAHRPDGPRAPADVVNLGFVLNVIEDPGERLSCLREAYALTRQVLIVAVIQRPADLDARTLRPLGDGYLTVRGTFQKCFGQDELRQYLESALGTTAAAVGLGIFLVFREPSEYQAFLERRFRRRSDARLSTGRTATRRPGAGERLYTQHQDLLDAFWARVLELGREPLPAEFARWDDLRQAVGSGARALRLLVTIREGTGGSASMPPPEDHRPVGSTRSPCPSTDRVARGLALPSGPPFTGTRKRGPLAMQAMCHRQQVARSSAPPAVRGPGSRGRPGRARDRVPTPSSDGPLLVSQHGQEALDMARARRRADWVVYLAIASLRGPPPLRVLSESQKADLKAFFGRYPAALREGLETLHFIGDPDVIREECEAVEFGWQDAQALYVHRELVPELGPILRVYVGCAEVLAGDLGEADLVKIHKASGKVSFLAYADFERSRLPESVRRVKVNLRTQQVDVFERLPDEEPEYLVFKHRYVRGDHPGIGAWQRFSRRLERLGVDPARFLGPGAGEVRQRLAVRSPVGPLRCPLRAR